MFEPAFSDAPKLLYATVSDMGVLFGSRFELSESTTPEGANSIPLIMCAALLSPGVCKPESENIVESAD